MIDLKNECVLVDCVHPFVSILQITILLQRLTRLESTLLFLIMKSSETFSSGRDILKVG